MDIGERIKERRKELGWSQRELATRMNYDHSTVGRIERGSIDIPQSRIVQFSKVLNVPLSYLMGWDEDEDKPVEMAERHFEMVMDEDLNEIFDAFQTLDAKKKKAVMDLIRNLADAEV